MYLLICFTAKKKKLKNILKVNIGPVPLPLPIPQVPQKV